jgi:hypothetical protein
MPDGRDRSSIAEGSLFALETVIRQSALSDTMKKVIYD